MLSESYDVGSYGALTPSPRVRYPRRRGPYVEGVTVGPKERERRLAYQRVDRSHRRGPSRRRGHPPPRRTLGEKAVLVLILALIFAGVLLAIVMFLLPT
jgi:hypothetical protein